MSYTITKLCLAATILCITGCATSTIDSATRKGAAPLSVEDLYSLVHNNTLHLVSSDFDAHVYYAADGKIAANSLINTRDSGRWDIKKDASLCFKFKMWYYGDLNCYSVYQEPGHEEYLLFSKNGAFAYTATMSPGNSKNLSMKGKNSDKDDFMRSSLSKQQASRSAEPAAVVSSSPALVQPVAIPPGPAASREEINHTVQSMAQNCPGCNLEGADLRQAHLVGANLKGANLRRADLSRANLRRANLEGADLSGATLLSTNLPGANLKNANLSGTDLSGSNCIQTDFTGAELTNSIFKNTLQEGSKGLQ